MSNMTEGASQSTTANVKDRVQDAAQEAKGRTRNKLSAQIETRSSQLGDQMQSTAEAVRRTSTQLREDGQETPAKLLEQVAMGAERIGGYLTEADGNRVLRDVETFARRQPWVFAGGSAIVGFFGSRFMKASSERRYQESNGDAWSDGYAAAPASTSPPPARDFDPADADAPAFRSGGGHVGFGE